MPKAKSVTMRETQPTPPDVAEIGSVEAQGAEAQGVDAQGAETSIKLII